MSYILDALRRAEALRSRGAVPTLHAPVLDAGPRFSGHEPRRPHWSIWLLCATAVVAALLVAWQLASQRPPEALAQAASPAGSVARQTPPPTAMSPSEAGATRKAPVLAEPRAPFVGAPGEPGLPPAAMTRSDAQRPAARPSLSESAPRRAPAEPLVAPSRPARPVITLRSDEPPPPLPPSPTTVTPAGGLPTLPSPTDGVAQPAARRADAAIPARRDLGPDLQRELPALAISGMVYSADRAQRMVIVNGELLHEGDRIGPELVLEEIRRKEAVLRYKGQRFSISP